MQPTRERGTVHRAHSGDVARKGQWCCTAAAIISTAALAACASTPIRTDDSEEVTMPVQVLVRNDGSADVTVFAYRVDQRFRIGEVTSHSMAMVTVPAAMVSPGHVQLMLHKIGGGDYIADEVAIRPANEHAELHVLDILDESALTVAPGRMH
jgi:hypothetical protein